MTEQLTHETVLDDAWLSAPAKRSRLRGALVVLLAAALVFLGGVEVQKRYGAAPAAAAPTGARPQFALGGGALPSGQTGGGQTTGTTTQAAVIGTVVAVKNGVWTIKDLGGKTHKVVVGADVKIVKEQALTADQVPAGSTVDVSGSTDTQGQVTATTITVR
jgi:hypothetical protein